VGKGRKEALLFSEKKQRKILYLLGVVAGSRLKAQIRRGAEEGWLCFAPHDERTFDLRRLSGTVSSKSFLLLFFKKEALSDLLPA
jgi:hypothetical protein